MKYGITQIGGSRTNCFITQNTRNRRKTKRKKTHPPKNPIAKKSINIGALLIRTISQLSRFYANIKFSKKINLKFNLI